MSNSGTVFRDPQPGYPPSNSSWSREEHTPRPQGMIRDPWEDKLELGLTDMHEFHLKHHRKKPENSIYQLAKDASQISSAACHLMEKAGMLQFNVLRMSNKIHAYALMNITMKTSANVAGLEAGVTGLNEAAVKIIQTAAKVCAQLAEMNVDMTRISAEVNDSSARKVKGDVGGAQETAKQEWERRIRPNIVICVFVIIGEA